VYSALGADFSALMRYINSRFTYFLLSGLNTLQKQLKLVADSVLGMVVTVWRQLFMNL